MYLQDSGLGKETLMHLVSQGSAGGLGLTWPSYNEHGGLGTEVEVCVCHPSEPDSGDPGGPRSCI